MADDDHRLGGALERFDRGTGAFLEARLRIVERQLRRHGLVAALSKLLRDRVPAGAVVPGTVDQADGGHGVMSNTPALALLALALGGAQRREHRTAPTNPTNGPMDGSRSPPALSGGYMIRADRRSWPAPRRARSSSRSSTPSAAARGPRRPPRSIASTASVSVQPVKACQASPESPVSGVPGQPQAAEQQPAPRAACARARRRARHAPIGSRTMDVEKIKEAPARRGGWASTRGCPSSCGPPRWRSPTRARCPPGQEVLDVAAGDGNFAHRSARARARAWSPPTSRPGWSRRAVPGPRPRATTSSGSSPTPRTSRSRMAASSASGRCSAR